MRSARKIVKTRSRSKKPMAERSAPAPEKAVEPKSRTFEEVVSDHSTSVRAIAKGLRKIVREVLPNAQENVYGSLRAVVLYREDSEICGIQPTEKGCYFYFSRGAEIPDPDGLLQGKGRGIRHIKFSSRQDLTRRPIEKLLREAKRLAAE